MKTLKLLCSIAGIALTGLCFSQAISQNGSNILYYNAYYNLADNNMDHRIGPLPERITGGDHFTPVVTRTYYTNVDFEIPVEGWMTLPFESSYYEEEMQIESWMISPFDCNYYEEDIAVEEWMTRPFWMNPDTEEFLEEEIEVEEWMTRPWG